jgi:hypothetical protein
MQPLAPAVSDQKTTARTDGSDLSLRMENFETVAERDANRNAWETGLARLAAILA